MKKYLILISFIFLSTLCLAQEESGTESSSPSRDTEIERKCDLIDIEGKLYYNVLVTMKSTSPDYFLTDKYKVKILVEDPNGKKIYKKTFSNSYLYIFSSGQIQIGKPKFNQILIKRFEDDENAWYGIIREKEGVW